MNLRNQRVFSYSNSDREFKLYVGGCTTFEGISLLAADDDTAVDVIAAWFESDDEQSELHRRIRSAKTVSELANSLYDCWSLYDFSCTIGNDGDSIKLSSHDDGECHFVLPSQDACHRVVLNACPEAHGNRIWEATSSAPGCYACFCEESDEVRVFVSFDDYLAWLK